MYRSVVEHVCLLMAKDNITDEEEKDMLDYLYTTQYQMGGIITISLGETLIHRMGLCLGTTPCSIAVPLALNMPLHLGWKFYCYDKLLGSCLGTHVNTLSSNNLKDMQAKALIG